MKRTGLFLLVIFSLFFCLGCNNVHIGEDGSKWKMVSEPGFGDKNNVAVVAMAPFQGGFYAITRNDATGFQVWKKKTVGWKQVEVEGFTNGIFHEYMNNIWGDMIEFKDHLYVSAASGFQGGNLYKSVGCEIWRFDGEEWEPVISHLLADQRDEGEIEEIFGCDVDDGDTTAMFADYSKNWIENEWEGGTLWITGGENKGRVFRIIGNTDTTLIVQQSEVAATNLDTTPDYFNEYTRCDEFVVRGPPGYPDYGFSPLEPGTPYLIMIGDRINGFGDFWNKTIVDFEVFDDELYASIGLNYESGTHIMKTSDGLNWVKSSKRSFGLFHGYDWDLNETGMCLISGMEHRNGSPVCSSSNRFAKSSITGEETLFVGGTGSTGCNGVGARVFRLDGDEWTPIVDYFVDDNTIGTNENGFGDGATSFFRSNFQAWDWAEYDERLFVSVARIRGGARIMFTETGSEDDFQEDGITPTWQYNVGGDSDVPDGFGKNREVYGTNICMNLYTFGDAMYAGTYQTNIEVFEIEEELTGAHIWKMTGADGDYLWEPVFQDGIGDKTVLQIEAFTEFEGNLYVAASNVLPSNYWLETEREEGYKGAKIYRLEKK